MIILAFVDTHGDVNALKKLKKKSAKADLVICAGDMTIFEGHMSKMLKEIDSFNKPVLVLHGNHESEERLREACKKHNNLIYFHKDFYEKENILFVGYGGGGFALTDKEFEKFAEKIIKKKEGKKLVMVFHGPPYGNKTDMILGEHAGNKSYTKFIKEEKPMIVICGHLHENDGAQDKIGKTIVINAGHQGKLIEV
ncbi:MAG: metallophosphoesterase family protein [Nanoarchaeota archaeon]|nr:metallophosphoesterase family protein [Nanoarchaeota archaeon]MBU1321497.1 metallophosphoesterase family protein [Nanoarchaeota archaeon]MBU1597381.1 metallophosphoesterase family protein [Nanoarchaeota archaeon]MBU2441206.1 metallophosphoesterase family protein [Nanoarchaeota archaeon]